jgi:hypothetical protein
MAGLAALMLLPRSWPASLREALAWDLSAAIYLGLAVRVMLACKGNIIRARAARQDDSRMVILIIILLAITASFVGIVGLLAEAKTAPHKMLNLGLAAATIILSWTVMQVVFTLHYAHEYYRPSGGTQSFAEGLDFRGDPTPDYWDFFYFATSFGPPRKPPIVDPDQAVAPVGHPACDHLVLLQLGGVGAEHQYRRFDDLRGQSVEWVSPEYLTHLIATYGYVAIALIIGLESMGLPLPGESALVLAALYASRHDQNISGVVAAAEKQVPLRRRRFGMTAGKSYSFTAIPKDFIFRYR